MSDAVSEATDRPALLPPGSPIALLSESTALGGGERVVGHLGGGLLSRGYPVHLIVPSKVAGGWLDSTLEAVGARVHYIPFRTKEIPSSIRAIRRILKREGIAAANAHMPGLVIAGSIAAFMARVPFLGTLHNGDESWSLAKRRLPLALAIRMSGGVNVVSEAMRMDVAKQTWCSEDRLALIYNGAEAVRGNRDEWRMRLGLDDQTTMVLCLGSQTLNKDHATVVRAVGQAKCKASIVLVVAGRPGDGSRALAQSIATTSTRTIVLDHTDEVGGLLAAADIFVLSSHREGLPMVIVEAMLAGLAIATTRVGGIPEVLGEEESALFFTPEDSLRLAAHLDRLTLSLSLRQSLAAEACAHAQARLTVDHMVDSYLSTLSGIRRPYA